MPPRSFSLAASEEAENTRAQAEVRVPGDSGLHLSRELQWDPKDGASSVPGAEGGVSKGTQRVQGRSAASKRTPPQSSVGKESACNAGDLGSNPGLGRSPGEGEGSPLQCSGLENSIDCSPRGHKESDTTKLLSLSLFKWTLGRGHLSVFGDLSLGSTGKGALKEARVPSGDRCPNPCSWDTPIPHMGASDAGDGEKAEGGSLRAWVRTGPALDGAP